MTEDHFALQQEHDNLLRLVALLVEQSGGQVRIPMKDLTTPLDPKKITLTQEADISGAAIILRVEIRGRRKRTPPAGNTTGRNPGV